LYSSEFSSSLISLVPTRETSVPV